jgi:hypothetical protein
MKDINQLKVALQPVADSYTAKVDIYVEMYQYYVNFFKEKDTLNNSDIVIGVGFTYSWMPTILKRLNLSNIDHVTKILNNVKQSIEISDDDLLLLKEFSNNSLVGVSKLLHFINPEKYAIWDSRVFKFLNNNEAAHKYKLEKVNVYREYLSYLNNLKRSGSLNDVVAEIKSKINYPISDFRALELLFFLGSKNG